MIMGLKLVPELIKEKILIHPTRLLLFKYLELGIPMISSELRDSIGISWGEFSNHSKILSELGYIELSKKFENGSLRQTMRLTQEGIEKHHEIVEMLREYIGND